MLLAISKHVIINVDYKIRYVTASQKLNLKMLMVAPKLLLIKLNKLLE